MKRLLGIVLCAILLISTTCIAEVLTPDIKTIEAPRFVEFIEDYCGGWGIFDAIYYCWDDYKLRNTAYNVAVRGIGSCILDIVYTNGETEIYPEGKEIYYMCTGLDNEIDGAGFVIVYNDSSACVILVEKESYDKISYYHTDSPDEYLQSDGKFLWYNLSEKEQM